MQADRSPGVTETRVCNHIYEHAGKFVGCVVTIGIHAAQRYRHCAQTAAAVGLGGYPVAQLHETGAQRCMTFDHFLHEIAAGGTFGQVIEEIGV